MIRRTHKEIDTSRQHLLSDCSHLPAARLSAMPKIAESYATLWKRSVRCGTLGLGEIWGKAWSNGQPSDTQPTKWDEQTLRPDGCRPRSEIRGRIILRSARPLSRLFPGDSLCPLKYVDQRSCTLPDILTNACSAISMLWENGSRSKYRKPKPRKTPGLSWK